ncbi:hypothetical protein [Brachyspira hyodysenteriae]|uniref:hypothetical protein n=1 Tax=Brachyspira hyodysenteriae TaxID=159 RepID=UPI00063DCB4F|nr:hypothetical protein [Brachyspira hyodysenteriae]KLI43818.1 hypothetical protein SZ52_03265 [Brachyspira hyodysenteriae]KLI57963.1 hypothetical protein SZ45_02485 [Brachyspira hyodysenteriae]
MENKKIVYFDKNIFSQLKSGCQSEDDNKKIETIKKLEKIINSKSNFLYVYSDAHIFDLQNGNDNDDNAKKKREEDFEFTSRIVDNNYVFINNNKLSLDFKINIRDKFNSAYTVKLNDIVNKLDFTDIKKTFCDLMSEGSQNVFDDYDDILFNLLQYVFNFRINTRIGTENIPEDILKKIEYMLPKDTNMSIGEIMNFFMNEHLKMINSDDLYPKLKDILNNQLDDKNKEEIKISLENAKNNYNNKYFEYIANDLFNGRTSRKIKYPNTTVDIIHSSFIEYVDYFVTEDNDLYNNSIKIYGNEKIFKLNNFIELLN